MLDNLNCPICKYQLTNSIKYPGDTKNSSDLKFESIKFCENCYCGVAHPRYSQKELDDFYSRGNYWNNVVGKNNAQISHERNQAKARVELCSQYVVNNGPLKVLDIGAGHGWIVKCFYEKSICLDSYSYIEPDKNHHGFIQSHTNIVPIIKYDSLEIIEDKFNIIFINHVLEHVAEPDTFLTQVITFLNPGGYVYVETPHADYRFKKDVFPHTLFFTPNVFHYLAKKYDLQQLCCESFGKMPTTFFDKLMSQLFKFSIFLNVIWLQKIIDDWMWGYDRLAEDGIWLRWLIQKPNK